MWKPGRHKDCTIRVKQLSHRMGRRGAKQGLWTGSGEIRDLHRVWKHGSYGGELCTTWLGHVNTDSELI